MILGVGNDLIDIRRIEKTLERFGERFIARVFTEIERKKSDGRRQRAASYAKRFAAKEACAKALGTGLRQGVYWRDMGVVNLPSGRPTLRLNRWGGKGFAGSHTGRVRSPHRPDHHRRFSSRRSHRHHFRYPGKG